MFSAALVAECAGESYLTSARIAAALLRTESVKAFCSQIRVDATVATDALDDPRTLSFDECEHRLMRRLAADGVALGSAEHRAQVEYRPLEPVVRPVVGRALEEHGGLAMSPLRLLMELLLADTTLAERLEPHGLRAEALREALTGE